MKYLIQFVLLLVLVLAGSNYKIYDDRDVHQLTVKCDDSGYCRVYDWQGRFKYIIREDGKIYDGRERYKDEINIES